MTTYSPAALLDSLAGGLTKAGLLRPCCVSFTVDCGIPL